MSYKNLNSKNLIFENFPVQTKNVMAQVTYIQDFQIQWMVAQWQLINSTCFKLKFKTFSGSLLVNNVLICHQFLLINTRK